MKIIISNLDKSINKLDVFSNKLPDIVFDGMRDSAILLQDKIREVDPKYADTTVIEELPGSKLMTITIGPSIEYAPLKYMGERIRYMKFICPWWKTVSKEIRELVPSSTEIRNTVINNLDDIRNIIVNRIKTNLR